MLNLGLFTSASSNDAMIDGPIVTEAEIESAGNWAAVMRDHFRVCFTYGVTN